MIESGYIIDVASFVLLILSVIVNALWLVLRGLALPLNPIPWRVLLALRQELAHPRPAVPKVV